LKHLRHHLRGASVDTLAFSIIPATHHADLLPETFLPLTVPVRCPEPLAAAAAAPGRTVFRPPPRRWRRLDTDARGGKPNFHPFGKVEGNRKEEYERAVKKTRYPFKSRTTSDAEEAKEEQKQERKITTAATVTEEEWRPFSSDGSTTGDDDVPTFKELVEAPSSLCGQNFTQFDAIIPFERLQVRARARARVSVPHRIAAIHVQAATQSFQLPS